MRRVGVPVVLALLAIAAVATACGPASTPPPTSTFTIGGPSQKPRTPSATIEVPPPID
jgi:hypothetical protein